jgi:hypothetical protein
VSYGIVGCYLSIEGRVIEVETTGTFNWLDVVATDRIRSLNFPRFPRMSSCMGSGDLGGGVIVVVGISLQLYWNIHYDLAWCHRLY